MNDNNKSVDIAAENNAQAPHDIASELKNMDALSQYFKSAAGRRYLKRYVFTKTVH